MFRFLIAGAWLLQLTAAEPNKLTYTCKEDDIEWAGLTCSETDPCPIYLDLSGIAISGPRIVLAGNIHSAQSTLYSILLRSTDGGVTWTEPGERVRGEDLDRMQFYSSDTGWISGQQTAPLPGNPFFLFTRDGGKSWRKQPVLADGGAGSITQFRFDSATTGKLIIDSRASADGDLRYKLFETQNGGESWSVRESSETPIKGGPALEESTEYRLHPVAKMVEVQQRTGGKWNTVASFVTELTDCGKSL